MLPIRVLGTAGTSNLASCFAVQVRGRRRSTAPPPQVAKKHAARVTEDLTHDNQKFLNEMGVDSEVWKHKWALLKAEKGVESPLREQPWPRGTWTPQSKRTGLIARKIGVIPQWTEQGERVLCSLLEVLDNVVVNYTDPDTWFVQSIVGKKKAFIDGRRWAKMTIGAIPNPNMGLYTTVYRNMFQNANVPPKKRLASFMVTEDAALAPGTPLHASHFVCGQFVDLTGRTIDYGFEGVVARWGFKGGQGGKLLGVTKNHRRGGSVGSTGDSKVWPGKRQPGHMGWEWRHLRGVQILRIDHTHNVLYVKGITPGEVGEILQVKDSWVNEKCIQNPPFPTHFPEETPVSREVEYAEGLFDMSQPTVRFEPGEDEDYMKAVAKAAIKKQAKAKRSK